MMQGAANKKASRTHWAQAKTYMRSLYNVQTL